MANYHDINVPDSDDDTRFSQMVDEEEINIGSAVCFHDECIISDVIIR